MSLALVGGAAGAVALLLGGVAGLWLLPLAITAPVAGVLAFPVAPLKRLLAALEALVVRRVGMVVTLATFFAGAALVTFAMVATVASPEFGSELAAEPGGFAQLIGQPIAWGLWMVPAALQTAVTAVVTDAIPTKWKRLRRALAGNTVAGLILLLVLFGVLSQQLALLALTPFFQES